MKVIPKSIWISAFDNALDGTDTIARAITNMMESFITYEGYKLKNGKLRFHALTDEQYQNQINELLRVFDESPEAFYYDTREELLQAIKEESLLYPSDTGFVDVEYEESFASKHARGKALIAKEASDRRAQQTVDNFKFEMGIIGTQPDNSNRRSDAEIRASGYISWAEATRKD